MNYGSAVKTIVFLVAMVTTDVYSQGRGRRCCRYNDADQVMCPDRETCLVYRSGTLAPVSLDSCQVSQDSKKDVSIGGAEEQCAHQDFSPDPWPTSERRLPFSLRPYLFQDEASGNPQLFTGVDLRLDYGGNWTTAKFRMKNTAVCQADAESEHCRPRCVTVEREFNKGRTPPSISAELSYDCEVGFYVFNDYQMTPTSGDSYQLDIRLESAVGERRSGSFLFVMPEITTTMDSLPLLDKTAMEGAGGGAVVLHTPGASSSHAKEIQLWRRNPSAAEEEMPEEIILNETREHSERDFSRLILGEEDLNLKPGIYRFLFDGVKVAEFEIAEDDGNSGGNVALGIVLSLILAGLIAGLAAYAYHRYIYVKVSTQVTPNRLLDSGRITAKSVFIITNVDNRHHINIVLDFNKYLKSHCAVGEVYFALDPKTGITSQSEHDPWKWAQEASEKMGVSEDSCLVFIAGPPAAMGVPLYRDLQNNQAFVGTKYLKTMVDERRVAVIHFPYSDAATVPSLVPPHVRAKPHHLPRDMNQFLCQLLEIKKRQLSSYLPIPLVTPQVVSSELTHFRGGKEILDNVESLRAKVELHLAEVAKAEANGSHAGTNTGPGNGSTLSRDESGSAAFSDNEEKALLRRAAERKRSVTAAQVKERAIAAGMKSESRLNIELEPNILSLRDDDVLANRDKTVHPEFSDPATTEAAPDENPKV